VRECCEELFITFSTVLKIWRDGTDRNLGNINMKMELEWEKVELIFECHNYSEEKKVKLADVNLWN
jgi:hypothetical protein